MTNYSNVALGAVGAAFAVLALASGALADFKNANGAGVKCSWVTETECSQEVVHGPIVCHTRRVWDCDAGASNGLMKE